MPCQRIVNCHVWLAQGRGICGVIVFPAKLQDRLFPAEGRLEHKLFP
jgi:hypothetical protein